MDSTQRMLRITDNDWNTKVAENERLRMVMNEAVMFVLDDQLESVIDEAGNQLTRKKMYQAMKEVLK